ncbi:MOSC domain-containing protein [Dyadobacter sandarakinus]|uniref:MOSC domain-containing protein n=2 Tax=Dyadobacter sandarakinus TaxID=2747268 RepID=A0ABX7IDH1_9BACT|nr:MOSC domain-containing protein [Dyadobacter sandarakinus]
MTLSEIWIYPVKSLGGISLREAHTEERGLQDDRRWMVVDEENVFVTQRVLNKMALIGVEIQDAGLRIFHRHHEGDEVLVPREPVTGELLHVKVWDDIAEAVTVTREADEWLTRQLGKKVRLVVMPESTERKADPRYAQYGENVSFADGFPYHLISQASLDDLNARLADPVTMRRFRPNLVVTGADPYAEDAWTYISIGDVRFQRVKPCARCVLTTIDPQTAEKGTEPLKTLATYRRMDKKVIFGQDFVLSNPGLIRIGDPVTLS